MIQVLGSSLGVLIINKTGRKPLLIVSLLICSVCMAGLGGCYYIISSYETLDSTVAAWIALVCLIIFTFSFTAGLAPVPWVLVGELLPGKVIHTPLFYINNGRDDYHLSIHDMQYFFHFYIAQNRSIVTGVATSVCYVSIFFSSFTFPLLSDDSVLDVHGSFWLYAVIGVLGLLFTIFVLPKDQKIERHSVFYRKDSK